MKTRILVMCDNFLRGGLETHIISQANVLSKQGVDILLATGSAADDLPEGVFADSLTDLKIGPQVTSEELLITLNRIKQFIINEGITLINAHPFYSTVIGLLAAQQSQLPFVVTMHGPVSLHKMPGQLYNFLFRFAVLTIANRVYCVSRETEILCRSMAECRTELLPNAVDVTMDTIFSPVKSGHWLWAGRFDSDKVRGLIDLIEKIDKTLVDELHVFGDGPQIQRVKSFLFDNPNKAEFVRLMGWCNNIPKIMSNYAVVAGMGRVLLEGAAANRPCLLVGYDGVKGLLDIEKFQFASFWNLSGRGLPTITAETLRKELNAMFENSDPFFIREWVVQNRNESVIWNNYLQQINSLKPLNDSRVNLILDAMQYRGFNSECVWSDDKLLDIILGLQSNMVYDNGRFKSIAENIMVEHLNSKVDSLGSQAIFLEKEINILKGLISDNNEQVAKLKQVFIDHKEQIAILNKLLNNSNEQVTILKQILTDRDKQIATLNHIVKKHSEQVFNLQRVIAERDNQILSLNETIDKRDREIVDRNQKIAEQDKQINFLQKEIHDILSSKSWRITRPFRIIMRIIKLPFSGGEKRYQFAKALYWRLPEILRLRLNPLRQYFVSKRLKSVINQAASTDKTGQIDKVPLWINEANRREKVAIIPCAFEFEKLFNQRPINAAVYFADQGYFVIYVAWQWTPDERLKKGSQEVQDGIYQVPLYEFLAGLDKLDRRLDKESFIFITIPSEHFLKQIRLLRSKGYIIVYDIMDDWECFAEVGQAPWYDKQYEHAIILESDLVSAVSPSLAEKFLFLRRDIVVIGNGFNATVLNENMKFICLQNKYDRGGDPIIGYFGHLTDSWFDWHLIFNTAQYLQNYKFEIIGYGVPDWAKDRAEESLNITLIGKVSPSELYKYVQRWSVGIIPFRAGKLAKAVDPIKIYEYLFFGLPVVATGISHIERYPLTRVVSTIDDFIKALEYSTKIDTETYRDELEKFLNESTWNERFAHIERLIKTKSMRSLYVN